MCIILKILIILDWRSHPTVVCSKTFKIGLFLIRSKYIKSGIPFKGKIYSSIKKEI